MSADIDARALEIHAERRTAFTLGPPPYAHAVTVDHRDSGTRWTLSVSRHFPPAAYVDVLGALSKLSQHGDVDLMAYGLAWFEAANEAAESANRAAGDES